MQNKYYNRFYIMRRLLNSLDHLPEAGVAAAAALNIKGNENFINFHGAVNSSCNK